VSQTSPLETNSGSREWLREKVYVPRRERTYNLVRQAVESLLQEKQKVSLASVAAKTRQLEPNGTGVAESTILNNEEAKAYYMQHRTWKSGRPQRKEKEGSQSGEIELQIKPGRDLSRVRQRYMRLGKADLVQRLITIEQAYADQQELWLQLNDELLTWKLRAQKAETRLIDQ
jgi:hypothetical protein